MSTVNWTSIQKVQDMCEEALERSLTADEASILGIVYAAAHAQGKIEALDEVNKITNLHLSYQSKNESL